MTRSTISTRQAQQDDVPALCTLLNEIIGIGGTTAFEDPMDEAAFAGWFLSGPDRLSCLVALDEDQRPVGFQTLARKAALGDDWVDIATFAQVGGTQRGIGTALFTETLAFARGHGAAWINATIRADNTGGLAYYDRMGFETYKTDPGVPLKSGQPVDRISKRRRVG